MIDFNKPVQTRDGQPVRILATDYKGGPYPIIGIVVERSDGSEELKTWTREGRLYSTQTTRSDLVNVPEKYTRYVNVYGDHPDFLKLGSLVANKDLAEAERDPTRLFFALATITFER